jgi:hypothetical protein
VGRGAYRRACSQRLRAGSEFLEVNVNIKSYHLIKKVLN